MILGREAMQWHERVRERMVHPKNPDEKRLIEEEGDVFDTLYPQAAGQTLLYFTERLARLKRIREMKMMIAFTEMLAEIVASLPKDVKADLFANDPTLKLEMSQADSEPATHASVPEATDTVARNTADLQSLAEYTLDNSVSIADHSKEQHCDAVGRPSSPADLPIPANVDWTPATIVDDFEWADEAVIFPATSERLEKDYERAVSAATEPETKIRNRN